MANRFVGTLDGETNSVVREFIVTNGVTVTAGDFVYFDGSGAVTNSSIAGQRLVGMAANTIVGNGTRVVKVYVGDENVYLVDNDNDTETFAASHVGQYFDLTGATGAQLADTNTSTATASSGGQLLCIEYNPKIEPVQSDTSWGLFVISESAFSTGV